MGEKSCRKTSLNCPNDVNSCVFLKNVQNWSPQRKACFSINPQLGENLRACFFNIPPNSETICHSEQNSTSETKIWYSWKIASFSLSPKAFVFIHVCQFLLKLLQVLLMVLFRPIKITCIFNRYIFSQRSPWFHTFFRQQTLLFIVNKNSRSILCTSPWWIGRCMECKKHIQYILIWYLVTIKGNSNRFSIIMNAFVGWICVFGWIGWSWISYNCFKYALSTVEIPLRAPKSSHGKFRSTCYIDRWI